MKVTVVQIALEDSGSVLSQLSRAIDREPDTDLFILPEFSSRSDDFDPSRIPYLGPDSPTLRRAESWGRLQPPISELISILEETGYAAVFGSLFQTSTQTSGVELRSRAVFFDPHTGQNHYYDKTHIHRTEDFLRPGSSFAAFDTRFGRLGMLICYDMAFAETSRIVGLQGADLLCVISAVPEDFDWRHTHRRMIGAAAFNQYFVASANLGGSKPKEMGGHSGIYHCTGENLVLSDTQAYELLSAEIDLSEAAAWREEEAVYPFRRPELYDILGAGRGESNGR